MPHNFIGNILTAVKGFLGPEIVDNSLNPVHLTVAIRGYWIQSHLLRISDRFGFFSPGPPRLQVSQGAYFAGAIIGLGMASFWAALIVLLVKLSGQPVLRLAGVLVAAEVALSIFIWISVCFDHRRAPNYDWEDWKLRKEWLRDRKEL